MAHVDALIDKVADPALRQALREQVDTILEKGSFGLVDQQHKPETVELPHYKVRRGCKVRVRSDCDGKLYQVSKIAGGQATIVSLDEAAESWVVPLNGVVVVREFGEAIYPGLKSLGRVSHGDVDKPPHIVINAENYHGKHSAVEIGAGESVVRWPVSGCRTAGDSAVFRVRRGWRRVASGACR